jgi:hypothetical protein
MARKQASLPKRPAAPLLEPPTAFRPAPEVLAWIQAEILAEGAALHNPDHAHLVDADLAVLWAAGGFTSKMRQVIGTAEELMFRCNAWQRGRQEQQLEEWFGRVPRFLITLDATYALACSDAEWCALVEHELYHIAQKTGLAGEPLFTKEGGPQLAIRGHDVEEFVGVVRRYGVGHPGGKLAQLVAAANKQPEVSGYQLATACGTCLLRAA